MFQRLLQKFLFPFFLPNWLLFIKKDRMLIGFESTDELTFKISQKRRFFKFLHFDRWLRYILHANLTHFCWVSSWQCSLHELSTFYLILTFPYFLEFFKFFNKKKINIFWTYYWFFSQFEENFYTRKREIYKRVFFRL